MSEDQSLIDEVAVVAYGAVQAISQSADGVAFSEIQRLRRLLPKIPESTVVNDNAIDARSVVRLRRDNLAYETINVAVGVIVPWLKGINLDLSGSADWSDFHWIAWIESKIPVVWNYDSDLLVFCGEIAPEVMNYLMSSGQKRVFVLQSIAGVDLDSFGSFAVGCEADLLNYVNGLDEPLPSRVVVVDAAFDSLACANLLDRLSKLFMRRQMDRNTIKKYAGQWVEQAIANIPSVVQGCGVERFDGLFSGMPAILVSPGPSLNNNVDYLRSVRGRALIIAPMQSLRRLFQAGVRPDIVVVIDPKDLTSDSIDFLSGVPEDFLSVLAVGVSCHPNVIGKFKKVMYFSLEGPVDNLVEEVIGCSLAKLSAPSVALTGLLLANRWRCNPIVLVGQDLALSNDGSSYADGKLRNFSMAKQVVLPGYYGGEVQSLQDYALFHDLFEVMGQKIRSERQDVQLLNCTEGGAYIDGFSHVPLSQFLESIPPISGDEIASRLSGAFSTCGGFPQVLRTVENIIDRIDSCLSQVEKCRRLCRSLQRGHCASTRLAEEELRLRKLVRSISGFSLVYRDRLADIASRARDGGRVGNAEVSQELYDLISVGCRNLKKLFSDVARELVEQTSTAVPSNA